MQTSFLSYFRCPANLVDVVTTSAVNSAPGYFHFGSDLICYGKSALNSASESQELLLPDIYQLAEIRNQEVSLPFDLDEIVDNLRCETYAGNMGTEETRLGADPSVRKIYYWFRPMLPVSARKILQGIKLRGRLNNPFPRWPVDRTVDRLLEKTLAMAIQANDNRPIPFIWFWPDGKSAALIMTHDVEEEGGRDFCPNLMDIDDEYGFKASFQVVPEKRYSVSPTYLENITKRGFEVCVHDLNHDGNLYKERVEFRRRADLINKYGRQFGANGFRSGVLYRNVRWYGDYEFAYDMSMPNVAHLDPQGGGCCTVMPYFIDKILEIPVTATQDYSLFHILHQYSIDLWKQQTETILGNHGLLSFIIHPDYVAQPEPQRVYRELLAYLREECLRCDVWTPLPAEVNDWWRRRNAMELVPAGNGWEIVGEGKERARIAYAIIQNDSLVYSWTPPTDSRQPTQPRSGSQDPGKTVFFDRTDSGTDRSVEVQRSPSNRPERNTLMLGTIGSGIASTATLEERPVDVVPTPVLPGRPLRVAMVSYSFFENDNRVLRYATTLAKRGDHVDVFSLRREGRVKDDIFEGVHVHRLQGRVRDERSQLAFASRIIQFLLRAMRQVAKFDREQPYDLLHVHSVPDFMVFSAIMPRLRGTPVILDIHDILPEFYASKFGSGDKSLLFGAMISVERISTRFASHVIIANDLWRERLISRGLSPEKCTVVLNSPDRSVFTRSESAPTKDGKFRILYPGSINWHQGLDLAIRALHRISSQVPEAELHIYGEGPQKAALMELVTELGMERKIFIHPMLPLSEISQVMERGDLGVVPKRKDNFGNEAFSTKTLEFMAMGIPAVVADTAIDKYYFDDSVVTFFAGGDEEDLARKMLRLIQNPDARLRQVENATRFVQKMDWTAKKHEYLELVNSLVCLHKK